MPLHLRITGVVQGVGFRHFVRTTGERLGLAGWVRNTSDGAVELAAAGSPEAEQALLAAIRRGPSSARVAAVAEVPSDGVAPSLPFPFALRR